MPDIKVEAVSQKGVAPAKILITKNGELIALVHVLIKKDSHGHPYIELLKDGEKIYP
jgi:hypothetical protein